MSCDVFMSVPSLKQVEPVLRKIITKYSEKDNNKNNYTLYAGCNVRESERVMAKYFKSRLLYIHEPELSENRA